MFYVRFCGEVSTNAEPIIRIYNQEGIELTEYEIDKKDGIKHQYAIDLSKWDGMVKIVFDTGNIPESEYEFSDITLY
jgi:hypothetical protein